MLDNGKFAPAAVLTDMAKGFTAAFKAIKRKGIWVHTKHLWCRWHIYEAIRRSCKDWFVKLGKDQAKNEMDRYFSQVEFGIIS